MKKKLFIIAGEKSGDIIGEKILKNLDKNQFDYIGIGGELMEKEGLKSIFSIDELSIMGIFEILPKFFKLIRRINETAENIIKTQPDIVLTIDSPDFCFRVIKKVKRFDKENKIKKIHFIAPSVWIYRKKRAEKISKLYDLLLCILPFEPPYFEKYGLKTVFVGHPIFYSDSIEYSFNQRENLYNNKSKNISITVGSRNSEVKILLPIIKKVIQKLNEKFNFNYYFLATKNTFNYLKKELNCNNNIKIIVDENEKKEIIKNSLLGITKSGTNTFEFSAFSIPIVMYYKFNFLTNIIARKIKKNNTIKFANLINRIANKEIIPECIIEDCNANKIYNEVSKLIENEILRKKQIEEAQNIIKILGFRNTEFSSKLIVNEINNLVK